ncbi:hypothetical protein B9Z55_007341 [Caenorhabditis nigoni]|uniref:Uncharacterized protein n=1 Tax=Caenorhabditis nigoni TaxID=1611254 RepID=A0A2G5V970_9PELO|nr:hypothetical protein B9Z55_007341 [Caenorhabditis nigoni]
MSSPSSSQATNDSGQTSDLLNSAQTEKKSVKKKELKKENSRMKKQMEEMQKNHEKEIRKMKWEVEVANKAIRKSRKAFKEEEKRNDEFCDKVAENPTLLQLMIAMQKAQDENKELREKVEKLEEYEKLYKEAVLDKDVRERKLMCFEGGFNELAKIVNSEEIGRTEQLNQMAEKLGEIKRNLEDEAKELESGDNQKDIPSTSGGPPLKKVSY